MGRYSLTSSNINFNDKYCMGGINVYATWKCKYEQNENVSMYADKRTR